MGGSADRPADARAQERAADPTYVGLRIVRGELKKKEEKKETAEKK